jgi:hypothetical protein
MAVRETGGDRAALSARVACGGVADMAVRETGGDQAALSARVAGGDMTVCNLWVQIELLGLKMSF